MDTEDKVRENRARRAARRQGLELKKSKARDPRALDYGKFQLSDVHTNTVVAGELGGPRALSIEQVEAALNE